MEYWKKCGLQITLQQQTSEADLRGLSIHLWPVSIRSIYNKPVCSQGGGRPVQLSSLIPFDSLRVVHIYEAVDSFLGLCFLCLLSDVLSIFRYD